MLLRVNPIIAYETRGLCPRPYPGHKHGCPNFGKKEGCPPNCATFDRVFDLTRPIYAIYNMFNIGAFAKRRLDIDPNLTDSQAYCCLYWQNTARKQLSEYIKDALTDKPDYYVCMAGYKGLVSDLGPLYHRIIPSPPEAMGVDVTETMSRAGIKLEWPPRETAYQIALAGVPRKEWLETHIKGGE
jgi:predicted metal-binding protein